MVMTDYAIMALAVFCTLFLPTILFVTLRNRQYLLAAAQKQAQLDGVLARGQTSQTDKTDATMDAISEQITEIRKGFDWLVSDRMIQQAIDMAQAGTANPKITAQTGISSAELIAITKCRNH